MAGKRSLTIQLYRGARLSATGRSIPPARGFSGAAGALANTPRAAAATSQDVRKTFPAGNEQEFMARAFEADRA